MKKTIAIILTVFCLGCTKNSSTNPSSSTDGTIEFVNSSSNPYNCYVDGVNIGSCSGGQYITHAANAGTHSIEVKQLSGYLVYPTDESDKINVVTGQTVTVSFP